MFHHNPNVFWGNIIMLYGVSWLGFSRRLSKILKYLKKNYNNNVTVYNHGIKILPHILSMPCYTDAKQSVL